MRILMVDHMQMRRYGNVRMMPGRKLVCGAIRNNWRLTQFSDRDVTRYLAPLGIRPLGAFLANKKLIKTAINFKPDLLFIGHCDYIRNWALQEIRTALPHIRMAHFNVDPLWLDWPIQQIQERMHSTDGVFVTTAGEPLKQFCTGKNFSAYMPNPSETCMEVEDNSQKTIFERDLLFVGKEMAGDERNELLKDLHAEVQNKMKFDIFGMFGNPPVWGAEYERVLASTRMALNLNRNEGWYLYSSDRIAHLMGSGILTFISDRGGMQKFFSESEVAFFHDRDDLTEKVIYFNEHDEQRRSMAAAGRDKYHKLFNSARTLKFMVETLMNEPYSEDYEWAEEVYR